MSTPATEAEVLEALQDKNVATCAEAIKTLYDAEWKALATEAIRQQSGKTGQLYAVFHEALFNLWKRAQGGRPPENGTLRDAFRQICAEIAAQRRPASPLMVLQANSRPEAQADKRIKGALAALFEQQEIIPKLKSRDRRAHSEALRLLYTDYYMAYALYLGRKFNKEHDVEDVFQDSLLALWRNFQKEGFELNNRLKTYLIGIVKNKFAKKYKKEIQFEEIPDEMEGEAVPSVVDTIIDEEQRRQKRQQAKKLLLQLGDTCAKILELHEWGHTYEEIAADVGHDNGDVTKAQAYRCRRRLRRLLSKTSS
jgi:RNA polymerase sigma factor (sigma-70 family)